MAEKHIFSSDDLLSLDSLGRKPTILINIADDDTTRGDTAGRIGLANAMANKINADVLYADNNTLRTLYPEQGNKADSDSHLSYEAYSQKLSQYLSNQRPPDIVLGFSCPNALQSVGKNVEQAHYIEGFNEDLSRTFLKETAIVAHHLTDKMLEEEGLKFDDAYPDLKKPLIAVFLVNPYPGEQEAFIKKMVESTEDYKEATIFLCGSRRTNSEDYNQLEKDLSEALKQSGTGNNITVSGFKFDRDAEFNPYRGLISRADHFILWGTSMSMMSEPLITGKTVHLYQYDAVDPTLLKQGVIAEFDTFPNLHGTRETFINTQHFDPINITEQLADKLVEKFKTRTDHLIERQKMRCERHPKEWQSHLVQIYFDYHHLKDVPDEFLKNDDFIKAALENNGMAFKYLTEDQRKNIIFIETAVINNPKTFQALGELVKDNAKIMTNILSRDGELYKECADNLKSDIAFNLNLLERHINIFKNGIFGDGMSVKLLNDEKIALAVIRFNPDHAGHFPKFHYNDPDFVNKVLDIDFECFQHLPEKYRDDETIVKRAIEHNSYLICSASERIRDNKTIMLDVIKDRPRNISYASNRLVNDRDFIKEIMEHTDVSYHMSPKFYNDKEIMLLAIKKRGNNYFACHEGLRNDPEICIATVKDNARFWFKISDEMKENPDVAFATLQKDPEFWKKLPEKLKKDPNFTLKCIKEIESFPPDYVHSTLKDNYSFIKEITDIRPSWRHIPTLSFILGNDDSFSDNPDICLKELKKDPIIWKYVPTSLKEDPEFLLKCVTGVPNFTPGHISEDLRNDIGFLKRVTDIKPAWANIPDFFKILQGEEETTQNPPPLNKGLTSFNALALSSASGSLSFGSEQIKTIDKISKTMTNPLKPKIGT